MTAEECVIELAIKTGWFEDAEEVLKMLDTIREKLCHSTKAPLQEAKKDFLRMLKQKSKLVNHKNKPLQLHIAKQEGAKRNETI